jgi:hypothetical protein
MSVKSEIACILGKRITGLLVARNPRDPRTQLFLAFDDGTHYELYGDLCSASGLDRGGLDEADRYASRFGGVIDRYE